MRRPETREPSQPITAFTMDNLLSEIRQINKEYLEDPKLPGRLTDGDRNLLKELELDAIKMQRNFFTDQTKKP